MKGRLVSYKYRLGIIYIKKSVPCSFICYEDVFSFPFFARRSNGMDEAATSRLSASSTNCNEGRKKNIDIFA